MTFRIFATLVALLLVPALAQAADTAAAAPVSPKRIFALLFLMLGPIKILVPFVHLTAGADATYRRKLATRAIIFSAAALLVAGLIGNNMLNNFAIPIPVLALTAGLVLFLIALQTVLEQFHGRPTTPPPAPPQNLAFAANPLAFPTIVTPYGIAATIIFTTLAESNPEAQATIIGLVALILALDWLAMMFAQPILKYCGTIMQVFAVVLGVNQIALGLWIILSSLAKIGVFTLQVPS